MVGLAAMRMIGPVESYRAFGQQDHLCWVHGDPWDYRPRLSEFVREGLERPLRVAYLGSGNAGELRALQRIRPTPGDSKLILDMSAVQFMDHHALLSLDSYAEACAVPVFVRSTPPIVRRVARVLGLEHLVHLRPEDL